MESYMMNYLTKTLKKVQVLLLINEKQPRKQLHRQSSRREYMERIKSKKKEVKRKKQVSKKIQKENKKNHQLRKKKHQAKEKRWEMKR